MMLRRAHARTKRLLFHQRQYTHCCLAVQRLDAIASARPVWRNLQTRTPQIRVPKRSVGSTPTTGTTRSIGPAYTMNSYVALLNRDPPFAAAAIVAVIGALTIAG